MRARRAGPWLREHLLRLTVIATLALTLGAYMVGWASDRAQDAQRTDDNRSALIASCERGNEFRRANNAQDAWVADTLEKLRELTAPDSPVRAQVDEALADQPPPVPLVDDCSRVTDDPPTPPTTTETTR